MLCDVKGNVTTGRLLQMYLCFKWLQEHPFQLSFELCAVDILLLCCQWHCCVVSGIDVLLVALLCCQWQCCVVSGIVVLLVALLCLFVVLLLLICLWFIFVSVCVRKPFLCFLHCSNNNSVRCVRSHQVSQCNQCVVIPSYYFLCVYIINFHLLLVWNYLNSSLYAQLFINRIRIS